MNKRHGRIVWRIDPTKIENIRELLKDDEKSERYEIVIAELAHFHCLIYELQSLVSDNVNSIIDVGHPKCTIELVTKQWNKPG